MEVQEKEEAYEASVILFWLAKRAKTIQRFRFYSEMWFLAKVATYE